MNKFIAVFVIVLAFIGKPVEVLAQSANEARVTLSGSFALSSIPIDGRYPVVTYLPITFLLFDVDENSTRNILSGNYFAATTQDGVRLLVRKNVISPGSFPTIFGDQGIIFNSPYQVCLTANCDKQDDDELLRIRAGAVFSSNAVSVGDNTVMELVGNQGNRLDYQYISGYISQTELEGLNKRSVVTFATLTHPQYSVVESDSFAFNTTCGEGVVANSERDIVDYLDADIAVVSAFDLGQYVRQNSKFKFSKSYGDVSKEVVYKLYTVTDRRSSPAQTDQYAAQIVYRCNQANILRPRIFIESVSMKNIQTDESFFFTPEGTPDNLFQFTGAPYLYSINSSEQYFLLMDILSRKISSRALAGYFISAFNRTCRGRDRNKAECQHDSYNN
tara:strand:- start:586 stop:1752 length:1167 start_codon:yes stop_codon:yes gene_type:complete